MQAAVDFLKSYLGFLLSLLALCFSVISFFKARRATLYSDMDGRYLELVKLGIINPRFVDPNLTINYKENFKGEELLKYERYAFAAWNIVETICDRRGDEDLFKTWKPVAREENRLHRRWFNSPENQHKFKTDFWKFMLGNDDFPCPDCEATNNAPLCTRCSELKNIAESNSQMPIVRVEQ